MGYPQKRLAKDMLFWQIQITQTCCFGKFFAEYVSLETTLRVMPPSTYCTYLVDVS